MILQNIYIQEKCVNMVSSASIHRFILFLFILHFLLMGCNTIFPDQSKPDVPGDHTQDISGVMHKPGLTDPFHPDHGCSRTSCHGDSLTGSAAISSGRHVAVPSCYQCHGALWEEEDPDHEDDD